MNGTADTMELEMEDTDHDLCSPEMVRQDSGQDSGLDSAASEVSNILSEAMNDSRPDTPGTPISRDEDVPGSEKSIPDRTRSAPPSPTPHTISRRLSSLDDDASMIFSDAATTVMPEDSGISRKRNVRQQIQSERQIFVTLPTLSTSGTQPQTLIKSRAEESSTQSESSVSCRTEETISQSQASISSCIAEPSTGFATLISSHAEQIDPHSKPPSPCLTAKFVTTTSKLRPNAACFEPQKEFYIKENRDIKGDNARLIKQFELENIMRTQMEERVKKLEDRLEEEAIYITKDGMIKMPKKQWEDHKKTLQSEKDRVVSHKHQLAQKGYQIEKDRAAHKNELKALVAAHRIEIEDLQQANQVKTKALEESHENEIKALKAAHQIAIEAAKSDCLDELDASKIGCQKSAKSDCQREIEAVKTNCQNEIETLKASCQKEIEAAISACQHET